MNRNTRLAAALAVAALIVGGGSLLGVSAAVADDIPDEQIVEEVPTTDPPATDEVIIENAARVAVAPATAHRDWLAVNYTGTSLPTSSEDSGMWDQNVYNGECTWGQPKPIQGDDYLYDTPEHIAKVDSLDDDGKLVRYSAGNYEDSSVYITHTYSWQPKCVAVPTECPAPTVKAVSTPASPQGVVLHGDVKYVDGGLLFTSDAWVDAYASVAVSFPLADARQFIMSPTVSVPGDPHGFAVILVTAGGDRIHAESVYTDELWANTAVLPVTGGGQGGPYSGSLEDALTIGNPEIVSVEFLFTSATSNTALLTEAGVNCWLQPFDTDAVVITTDKPGKLADTGVEVLFGLLVGLGALVVGGGLKLARRR